jgi:hypothetical protein
VVRLPTGQVCLGALRHISARAAAILDCYSSDQAIWVPATAFRQFMHTLCWGNFADLDLHLLEGIDPADRSALLEELRLYHEYLRRQRERVDRFHHAYRDWLDDRESRLPQAYLERLRYWRHHYGALAYFRITGLATRSGFQQFSADPQRLMAAFEQAFAELAKGHSHAWQQEDHAGWFSDEPHSDEQARLSLETEQALRLLGLSANAPFTQIRRAYRRRAKMLHPDWQGEKQTAQMAALNEAYHVLCEQYRSPAAENRSH